MLALPDYFILDFADWIVQNYRVDEISFDLENRKMLISYAQIYLNEQNGDCRHERCKNFLKRHVDRVIESKEFDEIIKEFSHNKNYTNDDYFCLYRCHGKLAYLLWDQFRESMEFTEGLKRIDPDTLVDSLHHYINNNEVIDHPVMRYLITGCSSEDVPTISDFLDWMEEQDKPFHFYKMPSTIFDDVVKKYESDRGIQLSAKSKKTIVKNFGIQASNQVLRLWNKLFGKRMDYAIERYYRDKARYKCVLLPLKGESKFKEFVKSYWDDLDRASSDFLDIFYSLDELDRTGFDALDKMRGLEIPRNQLPCIAIWGRDISSAKAISVRKLSNSDLFRLFLEIISSIEKNMDFEQICGEALQMVEKLKEENRMLNKIENNIEQNIHGTNYGAIVGIHEGDMTNVTSPDNSEIQKDIKTAREKIEELEELNCREKEFLCKLLEDAGSAISEGNDELRKDCVSKLQGFIAGAGKVAISVLNVLGSIASIASFFGTG